MANDVQPIFELSKKIRGLMDWAIQANVDALSSTHAIAKATQIARATLNSNIEHEQISPARQAALAKAFGFRVDWPEWRDPNATRTTTADQRRDFAEAFLIKFLAHKSSSTIPMREVAVTEQHLDHDGGTRRQALATSMESVAPMPRLAAELNRVAQSARHFVRELAVNTNFEEDAKFPKQRLIDVASTVTNLSAGSADGALPALEFAETVLADMRFSAVEIAAGDNLPDFVRGGRVDASLGQLISDISTAKRFYSQSKLDAAAKTQTPDYAVAEIRADQSKIADRAQAISQTGVDIAGKLDKSTTELAERHDPDHVAAENLSRQSRDVANLIRQEGIEIGGPRPRISWLEKLDSGLEIALRSIELTASLGEITVQKIGGVLIKHFKDWFTGAREWAEETRLLVATMKRKWQVEKDKGRSSQRSNHSLPDFSIIRDGFNDGLGQGPALIVIPAGEFQMGSALNEARLKADDRAFDNEIVKQQGKRSMRIARRFALGRYPVTFEDYDAFLAATSGERARDEDKADASEWGGRRPVVNVSWNDAQAYCDWLNQRTGLRGDFCYRLPSEAEWEYACRAGTPTRRWWGDDWDPAKANGNDSFEGGKTSPVDHYAANPWRLHDMMGNVWEWCVDLYSETILGLPPDGAPYGELRESTQSFRVLRGGSWSNYPQSLRSANRVRALTDTRKNDVGFRVARTL